MLAAFAGHRIKLAYVGGAIGCFERRRRERAIRTGRVGMAASRCRPTRGARLLLELQRRLARTHDLLWTGGTSALWSCQTPQ